VMPSRSNRSVSAIHVKSDCEIAKRSTARSSRAPLVRLVGHSGIPDSVNGSNAHTSHLEGDRL
jgi:hypothetical protein